MQLQPIPGDAANVISITKVREDIDSLTRLLDEFGRVRVLRGTKVYFEAVDPDYEQKRREKVKKAAERIKKLREEMAVKHPTKPGELSATEWLIRERDRMMTPEYYEEHNR